MSSRVHDRASIWLAVVALLFVPVLLQAQVVNSPRLAAIFPPGAKSGTDCELTITGDGLEGSQQLLFSNPAITAAPVIAPPDRFYPAPRPVANHFNVHVGANVPPGACLVRLVSPLGVSNSRTFMVGQLPEVAEKKPGHDSATATRISVNSVTDGVFTQQQSDFYRFAATRGQRLVLHCAARLIDSRAEPRIAIYDSAGTLLRDMHDPVRIDPTFSFTAPADGEYQLVIHDLVFDGGPEYDYRLSISTGPWIDYVDPPFVSGPGEKHTLYGRNLPGSTATDVTINGDQLEKLDVTISPSADCSPVLDAFTHPGDAAIDFFAYRFTGLTGASNPVRLALAAGPLTAEIEPNDTPEHAQSISPPVQVVGRFNPRNDRDWYTFHARKGEKLWIEVVSQRLGLPTDPRLTVQQVVTDKSGKTTIKEIADVDDAPPIQDQGGQGRFRVVDDDPALPFTAPDDGEYRVLVEDIYSSAQGAPWFYYLLSIRPAHPDFRLLAYPARLSANEQNGPAGAVARKGCGTVIDVLALRRDGFTGAIDITAEGLPPGVTVRPGCIAPGASISALMLQVPPGALDWDGAIRIVGKAAPPTAGDDTLPGPGPSADAGKPHVAAPTDALFNFNNGNSIVPTRLRTDYDLAIRGGLAVPFTIDAGDGKVWRIPRGGTLQIPVKLARNPQFVRRDNNDDRDNRIRLQPSNQREVRAEGLVFDTGSSEEDLKVDVDQGAASGSYSLMLRADVQATLTPGDVGQQATDDLKRIEGIDKAANESVQKAARERERAEQAVNQTNGAVQQARQQQDAAMQADNAAKAHVQETAQHVKQLEQADAANLPAGSAAPTPAQVAAAAQSRAALAEARRLADDAAAKAKAADAALDTATRAVTDAQQKAKLAVESSKAAIADNARVRQDLTAADEARQVAEQNARKAVEISRPRDFRVQINSPPIRIDVLPAPFILKTADPAPIQAGGKPVEFSASIAPDFGFTDEVKFELVAPSGASGVYFVEKRNAIARNQTQATLALQADKNAPAGSFAYTLRSHYQFNKRDLTLDRPITIQVTPAAPAAKK